MPNDDPSILLGAAADIADRLERRAVPVREGGLTWVRHHDGKRQPIGIDLYSGSSGVALLFAAWARCGGGDRARELCLEALAPLRRRTERLPSTPGGLDEVLVGIGTGLTSIVYALTLIADLLEAPELLIEARELLAAIPQEAFREDPHLDLVSGSAGAVLASLALESSALRHDIDPDPARQQARCAGQRLRDGAVELGEGTLGWPPAPDARPVSGFAHGAAGIVFALAELRAHTGFDSTDLIRGGLAMERASFSPEAGNWRDLRVDHDRYMTMWCHGAPGIALGRLGMLEHVDDPALYEEIDLALQATRALPVDGLDHLCCGTLGRAEVLAVAARRLQRPEDLRTARKRALAVIARSRQQGGYRVGDGEVDTFVPGFFRGEAGIGYTLLRLAVPDTLPSVCSFLPFV